MQEEIDANTVIEHIYEASYKPEHWPIALEAIAKYIHASSAALLCQDNELDHSFDTYTYNISADTSAKHKAYGRDPNFQILSENVPHGTAAAIDHIIPDRNKLEDIYGDEFNELLKNANMYYLGGAILFMDDIRISAIGLQRLRSMGPWTKEQIDELNTFIPHIQRALNIKKEFELLHTGGHALRSGLDRLMMGLILFDKELRPIYINPVADSILGYHPAISMKDETIQAYNDIYTEKIHTALATAAASKTGADPTESRTSLGLKHPDCATVLPVIISRVQGQLYAFETEGHHAYAAMYFSDPDRTHPIDADQLSAIYGLTPAESQVAISIANGINPDEIAIMNNVAISTIRSHLKAIYHKLGINSQIELVKAILTGPFGRRL